MTTVIAVFTLQLVFLFLKVHGVKNVVAGGKLKQAAYSFGIQGTWLVATYLGINAVGEGDILTIIAYLSGGMLGSYLAAHNKSEKNHE